LQARLLVGFGLVLALDAPVDEADRADQGDRGHREHPGGTLLARLFTPDRHLVLEALLLERGLVLLALGGLVRLDVHPRLALRSFAGVLDANLLVALGLDPSFFRLADSSRRILLGAKLGLAVAAECIFFFLDAVLLDLAELA